MASTVVQQPALARVARREVGAVELQPRPRRDVADSTTPLPLAMLTASLPPPAEVPSSLHDGMESMSCSMPLTVMTLLSLDVQMILAALDSDQPPPPRCPSPRARP